MCVGVCVDSSGLPNPPRFRLHCVLRRCQYETEVEHRVSLTLESPAQVLCRVLPEVRRHCSRYCSLPKMMALLCVLTSDYPGLVGSSAAVTSLLFKADSVFSQPGEVDAIPIQIHRAEVTTTARSVKKNQLRILHTLYLNRYPHPLPALRKDAFTASVTLS